MPASAAGVSMRYVLPAEVVSSSEPVRFVTILGSCVAICLFDLHAGIGGINHFLLPGAPREGEGNALRWSDAAIAELFSQVLGRGATSQRLEAKVFGGAQITTKTVSGGFRIGERNIASAMQALEARSVPVRASAVGGAHGRKLVFDMHTGQAWIKMLGANASG